MYQPKLFYLPQPQSSLLWNEHRWSAFGSDTFYALADIFLAHIFAPAVAADNTLAQEEVEDPWLPPHPEESCQHPRDTAHLQEPGSNHPSRGSHREDVVITLWEGAERSTFVCPKVAEAVIICSRKIDPTRKRPRILLTAYNIQGSPNDKELPNPYASGPAVEKLRPRDPTKTSSEENAS